MRFAYTPGWGRTTRADTLVLEVEHGRAGHGRPGRRRRERGEDEREAERASHQHFVGLREPGWRQRV